MQQELIDELKRKLEKEKLSLTKELGSFAEEDKNVKNNWKTKYPSREESNKEEEADETQEYDTLLSLEHSLETKLKAVNMALQKIANGTYGVCEHCGKAIEEKRLMAYPEARLCMSCNRQLGT